jgi:hypothetical protein
MGKLANDNRHCQNQQNDYHDNDGNNDRKRRQQPAYSHPVDFIGKRIEQIG